MLMSDFGLDLYGNAIIVNPDFARQNPDAVRSFLRAAIRGYQEAIANPAAAIEHVTNRVDESAPDIELQRLVMAIGNHIVTDEVRSLGLGGIVETRLEKSINQLNTIYSFDEMPVASDVFDDSYLPALVTRQVKGIVSTRAEKN